MQGDRYETVCSGCPECEEGCDVEDDNIFPACTEVLENSESVGLNVTLETLQIAPGYWRATSRSRVVRPCYKTEACIGGLTGAKGYCREGYEGPCGLLGKVHHRNDHRNAKDSACFPLHMSLQFVDLNIVSDL